MLRPTAARAQVVVVEGDVRNAAHCVSDPERLAESILDGEESRRLRALRTPELRSAYLVSRIALRSVLAEALNVSASEITFGRRPCSKCGAAHGKPVLASPTGCEFSMSRTAGAVLIGISAVPIGVDIESVANGDDVARDVRHLLHPDEREELTGASDAAAGRAFLQLWCRKEAYLKGTGEGLTRLLDTDYLGHETSRHPRGWTLVDGRPHGRVVSAIALQTAEAEISWDVVPASRFLSFG